MHLDAGDLLLPLPDDLGHMAKDAAERERRAQLLATGAARLGLAALTPGEAELQLGVAGLRALTDNPARRVQKAKIALLAANLVDASGKLVFEAQRVFAVAGARIGVFGLLDFTAEDRKALAAQQLSIGDPVEAGKRAVAALRAQGASAVVGLLHLAGGAAAARELLAKIDGVDFAILGHEGELYADPVLVGRTPMLEASIDGKHLGRLDVHFVEGATGAFTDAGARARLQAAIGRRAQQMTSYRRRVNDDRTPEVRSFYDGKIRELEAANATDEKALAAAVPSAAGNWYEHRVLEVDEGLADHPGMAGLVEKYNAETKRRIQGGKFTDIDPRLANLDSPTPRTKGGKPEAPLKEDWKYGSTGACLLCHKEEHEQWQATPHARAIETLKKKGRDKDPECLPCHTTAFLRPGGTRSLATALTYFPDVGCESCHGPSVAHVRSQKKADTKLGAPEAVCRECHTPDQTSGEFDYPRYLKAVLGPGHGIAVPAR